MSSGGSSPLASRASPPSWADDGRRYVVHEVTRFDTLAGIAIRYGAEVADIKKANRISTDSQMFAMRRIRVPLSALRSSSPLLLSPTSTHHASSRHEAGGTSPAASSSATLPIASSSLAAPATTSASGSLSEAILELVSSQTAAEQAETDRRDSATGAGVMAGEAAGRGRASTFFLVQMREAAQYVSSEGEEVSPPRQRGSSLSEGEGEDGGRRVTWLGGGGGGGGGGGFAGFYSAGKGRGAGRSTWSGAAGAGSEQQLGWGLGLEEGGAGTSTWRGGYGSEGEGGWASGEEEVGGRGGGAWRRRGVEQSANSRRTGREEGTGVWGLLPSSHGLFSRGMLGQQQGALGSSSGAVNLGAAARWGGRVVEDLWSRLHKSTSFSAFDSAGLLSLSSPAPSTLPSRSPLRRDMNGSSRASSGTSMSTSIDLLSARSWIRPSTASGALEGGSSSSGDSSAVLLGCSTPVKGGEGAVCDGGSATALGGSAVYGSVTRRGVSSRRGKGMATDIIG